MKSSGKFSSILFWMLMVVMLQMLMLEASASVIDVSVAPPTINVGLSPSLDVNCILSTSTNSALAAIFSLTVSRGNNSDLASITSFADHQVNVMSSEAITADGVINPGGQSYIHLHWDYPTDTQKGTYQCVARGIDNLGHNVESVNTSVVSVDQIDLQDLVNEMRDLRKRMESLEYEVYHGLSALFHIPPLTHNNTVYYISKHEFHFFNESMNICKSHGGMLLEIDDEDEYHAVQQYLNKSYTGVGFLHIGGIDTTGSGNWVLPSTNQPLPFIDWYKENVTKYDNCLCMAAIYGWRMYSCEFCNMLPTAFDVRYMCELNIV